MKFTRLAIALITALASVASAQTGTGLTGKYYDVSTFATLVTTRTDATVNFDWGTAIPSGTTITDADYFSVVWTGQIEPEFTEPYTFYVTADDSATLWINDQAVCHRSFAQGSTPITGQIKLEAGKKVNIRLEYVELTGTASVKLEWASASRPREVIPTARLYPTRIAKAGGSLLKENWLSITGTAISALTGTGNAAYPNKPSGREFITSFECLVQNWADSYGARVTGYIVPQVTGTYTFAASGDDTVELWLSTDSDPAHKAKIASVSAPTAFRQWDANPATQQSAPRTLVQGQRYYVELLHKENTGTDHWSVGWKKPGDTAFSVIPGDCLMQAGLDIAQPAQASICNTIATGHPRLYATDEGFARLRAIWQSGTTSIPKTWADAIIAQADAVIPTAPVAYPLNVDTARVVMNNMYKLGLAWQLTNDSQYPERAYTELAAVGAFADWFPDSRTFLVTSETTHGFAIAYDWMYSYWTQSRRDTIRNAMINKGLNVALSSYKSNFWALRSNCTSGNWSIVCNSGIATGALAVGIESETLCEDILTRGMNSLRSNLVRFTTDQGALHEGPNYLEYAQRYAVRGLAGLEWALGSDFGLSAIQGISESAFCPMYTAGPSNVTFCASDDGESSPRRGWLWPWSARRFNQPIHNAWNAANASPIALDALWYADGGLTPATAGSQPDLACKGESGTAFKPQEYVAMRGSWKDSRTTFVAAKAGEIITSHGHYDAGTFALDALGKRWFRDLGKELYSISAAREDLYRYRTEGHNTLVIDPGTGPGNLSVVNCPMVDYQAKAGGAGAFAIYNLTAAHSGVTRVWRGFRLIGNRSEVLVQDEIQASTGKTVWWFAHYASPSVVATLGPDGTSVMLTQGAERLWCKIVSGGGTFQIMNAAPLPTSPNPAAQTVNSGYKKIAINLANVTNTTLAVWFVPLETGEPTPTILPAITALNTWQIDTANYPPTAGNGTVTSVNNNPVDIDLSTLAEDDNTPVSALTYAVSNAQGGSVVLDGRTARFTPTPGASGFAGFNFTATDSGALTSNAGTITVGGSPIVYTWNSLTSGNWSTAANWVSTTPVASYRGGDVRFLSGQSVAGTITATNDIAGTMQMNSLSLNGSLVSGSSATVNLGGNAIQLVANGLTLPTMALSGPASGFTYNVNNNIQLAANTTFNGANSGRVNFNGVLSGSGGFTRTGSYSTLVFTANNTYAGPTTISAGGAQLGSSGTAGSFGPGDVSLNAPLTISRSNAWTFANDIGGSGSITHAGTGTTTLSGNNSFTGSVTVNAGILKITNSDALGTGPKGFYMTGTNRVLQLSGGVTLSPDITLTVSTNSGDGSGISSVDGNNRIEGAINISTGNPALNISSANGTLTVSGSITLVTTSRTLYLGGSSTGANTISGVIGESGTSALLVVKQGAGTWILTGSNTYTGTTSVNAGTLVVTNGIASPAALTVASSAKLVASGGIASPITVSGTFAPGVVACGGTLSFTGTSRLQWEMTGNNAGTADRVDGTTVNVTGVAKMDVLFNSPGSTANFRHSFWRSARTIPVIAAPAVSGTFTLNNVSADSAGNPLATYGGFALQQSGTGVNLVWTPIPGFPVIDDPTFTLTSPSGSFVSIRDTMTGLRLNGVVTGGTGTAVAWTKVSGPGTVTFENASAANTSTWYSADGTYVLRCTVTNEVGTTSTDITVKVNPVSGVALRHDVDGLSHPATFVRADTPTWNSGTRDQVLVGNSDKFRALLSFDLSTVDTSLGIESVTLDVWTSWEAGTGTVGALDLHRLTTGFDEGTGNGISSGNGTGTGADWNTFDGTNSWSAAGGDYNAAVLSTIAGFNSTTTRVQRRFNSTAALVAATASVAGSYETLDLLISSTTSGASVFTRLGSNEDTLAYRPLLTINYALNLAPTIDAGVAPAATSAIAAALSGTATSATGTLWSKVGGPGTVSFAKAAQTVTSATFSQAGTYVLRLSGSNSYGETSRDLTVNVAANQGVFADWQATQWPGVTDPNIIGPNADPERDGLMNLMEWATFSNPKASTPAIGSLVKNGSYLEFTYTRRKVAPGQATFTVEYSDTLAPGSWGSSGVNQDPTPSFEDANIQTLKVIVPAGTGNSRFVRLKVVKPS